MVSFVRRCHETETRPISLDDVFTVIKTGDKGLKEQITQIRNRYEMEKDITGDPHKAKKAVADLKLQLPGFLPSGSFSKRENTALVEYSGLLCADLDALGNTIPFVRKCLMEYPTVRAVALSPSGDGLKVFFNVVNDPKRHEDSFRAIQTFLRDEAAIEIDEKCKDPARICFLTYDPDLFVRGEGNVPIDPLPPEPKKTFTPTPGFDLGIRQVIADQVAIDYTGQPCKWTDAVTGYLQRPLHSEHTSRDAWKDVRVKLDGGPNFYSVHTSDTGITETLNKDFKRRIWKAENRVESHISSPYRGVRSEKNDLKTPLNINSPNGLEPEISLIKFETPNNVRIMTEPPGTKLIGDYHICKDGAHTTVISGPPGVGKSLAAIALAVAGGRGSGDFFGLEVHRQFKTMILQSENGMVRLSKIFKELDCRELEDWVRVSEPPPYGFLFKRDDFRQAVKKALFDYLPDVVVIDPWNAVALDQEQATYLETFNLIRSVFPKGDNAPCLVIISHTRKPKSEERSSGRALMHIVAGSHVLVSVPRTVFVMQPGSDDTTDDSVVMTCCKNNNGELGKRSAWKRKIGLFEPLEHFDWATFDSADKRVVITEEMVAEIFDDGPLTLILARDKLQDISGASKASCYRALSRKGRFSDHLVFKKNEVNWLRK